MTKRPAELDDSDRIRVFFAGPLYAEMEMPDGTWEEVPLYSIGDLVSFRAGMLDVVQTIPVGTAGWRKFRLRHRA